MKVAPTKIGFVGAIPCGRPNDSENHTIIYFSIYFSAETCFAASSSAAFALTFPRIAVCNAFCKIVLISL